MCIFITMEYNLEQSIIEQNIIHQNIVSQNNFSQNNINPSNSTQNNLSESIVQSSNIINTEEDLRLCSPKERARLRQAARRASMTEEERERARVVNVARQRLARAQMSDAERQEKRYKNAMRMRQARLNLSEEERKELYAQRRPLTEAEQMRRRHLNMLRMREVRLNMSEEERQRQRAMQAMRMREVRKNMSPEEHQRQKELHAERMRLMRSRMSPEERRERRQMQKLRQRSGSNQQPHSDYLKQGSYKMTSKTLSSQIEVIPSFQGDVKLSVPEEIKPIVHIESRSTYLGSTPMQGVPMSTPMQGEFSSTTVQGIPRPHLHGGQEHVRSGILGEQAKHNVAAEHLKQGDPTKDQFKGSVHGERLKPVTHHEQTRPNNLQGYNLKPAHTEQQQQVRPNFLPPRETQLRNNLYVGEHHIRHSLYGPPSFPNTFHPGEQLRPAFHMHPHLASVTHHPSLQHIKSAPATDEHAKSKQVKGSFCEVPQVVQHETVERNDMAKQLLFQLMEYAVTES